jgi:ferritin-like metal-binding protein YciE
MEGLTKEGDEMLQPGMENTVRDAAIIAACQRVEHYEMAGYGCARTLPSSLAMKSRPACCSTRSMTKRPGYQAEADRHGAHQ